MINRFKEMMDAGIGRFDYVPLVSTVPETDPLCRLYNNIFSLATDTRMSVLPCNCGKECCSCPRRYAVTGSALMTDKWEKKTMQMWGNGVAIDFRPSGFWSISDFFYQNGLEGHREKINGDWAWVLVSINDPAKSYGPDSQDNPQPNAAGTSNPSGTPINDPSIPPRPIEFSKAFSRLSNTLPHKCPNSICTVGSQIPLPLSHIALKEKMQEIWAESDNPSHIAEEMNRSPWVKGSQWIAISENQVAGLVGNTVYIIG